MYVYFSNLDYFYGPYLKTHYGLHNMLMSLSRLEILSDLCLFYRGVIKFDISKMFEKERS